METKRNSKRLLVTLLILFALFSGCTEEEATIACAPDEEECATETEEGFAFGPTAGIAAGAAAVVALAGGLSGGGDDSNSGASANSGYKAESVSISDFNVVSTNDISEIDLRDWINNNSIFYNNMPSSGGSTSRSECIDNMEDTYGSFRSMGDNKYKFEFEMDIKACNSNLSEIKSEFTSKIIDVTAKKNDLYISLENKKLSEYYSSSFSDSGTFLDRYYRELIWKNNNKYIVRSYRAKSSDFNTPCQWLKDTAFDDCEYSLKWVYYYNNDLTTVTGIHLRQYKYNNVINGSGVYRQSGSIDFREGNWAGRITFIGSSTPSTFIAYNGDITITGALDTSQISNQRNVVRSIFLHKEDRSY